MALTNEDLKSIAELLKPIQNSISDMQNTISDMQNTISDIKYSITSINLHLENVTDKNIQLLAENHVELVKKLNQAIPVADKNLAYEVKVNYLVEEINKLKQELSEIKSKIA